MRNTREELMLKIQELQFACIDMNLYLDNHPEDKVAINAYNNFCNQLSQARYDYENKYGPLCNFGFSPSKYPYKWLEGPWPWEID